MIKFTPADCFPSAPRKKETLRNNDGSTLGMRPRRAASKISMQISEFGNTPVLEELRETTCPMLKGSKRPADFGFTDSQEQESPSHAWTSSRNSTPSLEVLGGMGIKARKQSLSTMSMSSTSNSEGCLKFGRMPIRLSERLKVAARRSGRNGLSLPANILSRRSGLTKKLVRRSIEDLGV